jgi:hypothetical protein
MLRQTLFMLIIERCFSPFHLGLVAQSSSNSPASLAARLIQLVVAPFGIYSSLMVRLVEERPRAPICSIKAKLRWRTTRDEIREMLFIFSVVTIEQRGRKTQQLSLQVFEDTATELFSDNSSLTTRIYDSSSLL